MLADALSRLPIKERQDPISPLDESPYAKFLRSVNSASLGDALDDDGCEPGHDVSSFYAAVVDDPDLADCFLNLPVVDNNNPFALSYQAIRTAQEADQRLMQMPQVDARYKRTLMAPNMRLVTFEANPNDRFRI